CGFTSVANNLGSTKQEIEIEESDTVLACLLRTYHIGFGTIGFQSYQLHRRRRTWPWPRRGPQLCRQLLRGGGRRRRELQPHVRGGCRIHVLRPRIATE